MLSKMKRWSENPTTNVIDYEAARASNHRQEEQKRIAIEKQRVRNAKRKDRPYYVGKKGEWQQIRYRVFKRDRGYCQCCGRSAKDGVLMHVDHIKPCAKYPELVMKLSNLQLLCEDCNQGKGVHDETDWR